MFLHIHSYAVKTHPWYESADALLDKVSRLNILVRHSLSNNCSDLFFRHVGVNYFSGLIMCLHASTGPSCLSLPMKPGLRLDQAFKFICGARKIAVNDRQK